MLYLSFSILRFIDHIVVSLKVDGRSICILVFLVESHKLSPLVLLFLGQFSGN